jgi:hypothetical protein
MPSHRQQGTLSLQSAPVRLWTALWIDIFIPLIILVQGFHSVKINFNAIKEKSIVKELAKSRNKRSLWPIITN